MTTIHPLPMAARFRLDELLVEREKRGEPMSQLELARRSQVSRITINAIANNRTRQVRLETLERLAAVLGVEPGDLIGGTAELPKRRRSA